MSLSPLATRLAAQAKTLTVNKGDVVFAQGEKPSGVFVVLDGSVRLSVMSDVGADVWSRSQGAGAILGLPACMSGHNYSVSAIAEETSTVAFVGRRELKQLAASDSVVGREILHILSDEVFNVRRAFASVKSSMMVP